MAYTIYFTPKAARQFARLTPAVRERLGPAIDALASDPRGGSGIKKLDGQGGYRLRVGNYRVLYEVRDRELIVLIVAAGHRREIYRGL